MVLGIQIRLAIFTASIVLDLFYCNATSEAHRFEDASTSEQHANGYVGNEACARCHIDIYQSYARSAMARASGPATEDLVAADFTHERSGVHYRIYSDAGKVWLSFDRPGDAMVHGKRELLYYVGQGRRGRTYLFSVDGFLFESPVNWYADRHVWDMAPAYGNAREIPMNLPTSTSCLDCHVSGVEPPTRGSQNRYPAPPFAYSGVTCERCHGPGAAHANGGAIVNPTKLQAKLRDQVCMQCHLEGNAAIERAGRHLYEYRPGDDLSKYVRYFVLSGTPTAGLRATSQFEALVQSACKQKSGDAMSCTSCHDPHQTIAKESRVAFYRGKCLACHGAPFAAKHHKEQLDCTACHMPVSLSSDVAHTQVTDHRIPRRPGPELGHQTSSTALAQLVPFPTSKEAGNDLRDLALASQSVAEGGSNILGQQGVSRLLRAALAQFPDDPTLLSSVGYLEQKRGADDQAREFYRKALKGDSTLIDAATNLAVLEAKQGHLAEAIKLWQSAFGRAPGKSEIGMNLARAYCAAAHYDAARNYTLRVLEFNPDLGPAKKLFVELNSAAPKCVQ